MLDRNYYFDYVFSFVQYVDVQPNDGFGTLLPLETIELDILFSAKKAKEYSFELTCKSGINRYENNCRMFHLSKFYSTLLPF